MSKVRPAGWCWMGLTAYVILADGYLIYQQVHTGDPKWVTMSTAFEDALHHPLHRWPVMVSWALLTAHLFDSFLGSVGRLEPIGLIGRWATRKIKSDGSR